MRIIINGVVHENPTAMRIEVDPGGETVGPFTIEVAGGLLTFEATEDRSAMTWLSIDGGRFLFHVGEDLPTHAVTIHPSVATIPPDAAGTTLPIISAIRDGGVSCPRGPIRESSRRDQSPTL